MSLISSISSLHVQTTHPAGDPPTQPIGIIGTLILWIVLVPTSVRADEPQAKIEKTETAETREPQLVTATRGMAVSVSAPASQIGVDILKKGGNAVDAAVAMALAMAVTYPEAGNIGGGGFMMIHPADGRPPVCIDYRETAPAAARKDTYSLKDNRLGHKVVGVPGTLRGLELAHKTYGKLPWRMLVRPAWTLAGRGFELDQAVAESLNRYLESPQTSRFSEFQRIFRHPSLRFWEPGDRLVQEDLAATLRLIMDGGADAFYSGPIADLLVREMERGNGLIRKQDLLDYRAKIRKPIHGTFHGLDIYGPPPPSSGGICLVEMLNILEQFPLKQWGRWSADTQHVMLEAMRRGYLDRARHLGDADFVKIPGHLVTKDYAKQLAADIELARATNSETLAHDIQLADEPPSTTHFSVVDAGGMAVSNTYTLEQSYGSRVVVMGAGFLLNNEMGDFNWKEGHTDRRGRIGTKANLIAPGKRMLSSQTPTIVAKDGKPWLVTGSPGGRTIINTVLCVVLNTTLFEMPLKDAVAAPRIHHQWLPDEARFESRGYAKHGKVLAELKRRGHKFRTGKYTQGDAHSIWLGSPDGKIHGVSDTRRSGSAVGFDNAD